jgi:DNA polymerase V
MFALIDCANFYASCERVFQPKLNHRPVVVLSSNDGCVIARSEEAKALGIEMSAPLFKIQDVIRWNNVHVCSSNFALYGDMSRRVMDIIQSHIQDVEIYSIDEAFVEFPKHFSIEQAVDWALDVRAKIFQWTGITTRVGIGATKTLAKLGNAIAKKQPGGIMYVDATDHTLLKDLPINMIWGFGHRLEKRLKGYAIHTVGQLLSRNREWVRKVLTVTGERTYYELKGLVCYPLTEPMAEDQKSLMVSRSFGAEVTDMNALKDSLVHYANNAGAKLRQRGLWTYNVGVYIRSSPFKDKYYSNFMNIPLNQKTQDTRILIASAHEALSRIYKPDITYKKSGLLLGELSSTGHTGQYDLLNAESTKREEERSTRPASELFHAIDALNHKYGRNTVTVGIVSKTPSAWHSTRNYTSPQYTTRWTDLPTV